VFPPNCIQLVFLDHILILILVLKRLLIDVKINYVLHAPVTLMCTGSLLSCHHHFYFSASIFLALADSLIAIQCRGISYFTAAILLALCWAEK